MCHTSFHHRSAEQNATSPCTIVASTCPDSVSKHRSASAPSSKAPLLCDRPSRRATAVLAANVDSVFDSSDIRNGGRYNNNHVK